MHRLVGVVGVLVILLAAVLMSSDRRAINWKLILRGLFLQFLLAVMILKVPFVSDLFFSIGKGVTKVLDYSLDGAAFVFGDKLARGEFVFFIRIGSAIIFVAAVSALLYHYGVMQFIVRHVGKLLIKALGISGPEAVSTTGAVLVGQVENAMLIKPYLPMLTTSELFCSITSSMSTVSGAALVAYCAIGVDQTHTRVLNPAYLIAASVMSAIGGIVIAKIMFPETQTSQVTGEIHITQQDRAVNPFQAFARAASHGWVIARNVMCVLLAAVAAMAMLNGVLAALLSCFGLSWTVQDMLGVCFTPIAFLMGVPANEAFPVARLMATEILVNEFCSYTELAQVILHKGSYELSTRTQVIATMALCGFANLGSVAINIGGLSAMVPERETEVSRLAPRALIAANFATWITAAMAGMLF